jgi:hypothetical protein
MPAQGRGQARRGKLLPLAARFTGAAAIDLHLPPFGIDFAPNKFHVLAHVEHQDAPTLLLTLLATEPFHQAA